jgi:hypothetical protein
MIVQHPPDRLIDQSDGSPIESIKPTGSRFERIDIKRRNDTIVVRAKEGGTDNVVEFEMELIEQLFRGVDVKGKRRRDVDDDIQDALQLVGYSIVDRDTQAY